MINPDYFILFDRTVNWKVLQIKQCLAKFIKIFFPDQRETIFLLDWMIHGCFWYENEILLYSSNQYFRMWGRLERRVCSSGRRGSSDVLRSSQGSSQLRFTCHILQLRTYIRYLLFWCQSYCKYDTETLLLSLVVKNERWVTMIFQFQIWDLIFYSFS